MKANKAPEKIQIHFIKNDYDAWSVRGYSFLEDKQMGMTEYTRTDVFMKRVKEAFCKAVCQGYPPRDTCTSLGTCKEYDNFVKYIKGE